MAHGGEPRSFSGISKVLREWLLGARGDGIRSQPVKNTFIHIESEQPDCATCSSAPAVMERIKRFGTATLEPDSSPPGPDEALPEVAGSSSAAGAFSAISEGAGVWSAASEGLGAWSIASERSLVASEAAATLSAASEEPPVWFSASEGSGAWPATSAEFSAPAFFPGNMAVQHAPLVGPAGPVSSVGSAAHASGQCRPCAHSWRPGGCANGAGCAYCHICGREDFLLWRRRSKSDRSLPQAAKARTRPHGRGTGSSRGGARHVDLAPDQAGTRPGYPACSAQGTAAADEAEPYPSVGSAGHSTGTCKPCAHSWKPGGCSKGSSCTFCHACTKADFLRAKRAKKVLKETKHRQPSGSERESGSRTDKQRSGPKTAEPQARCGAGPATSPSEGGVPELGGCLPEASPSASSEPRPSDAAPGASVFRGPGLERPRPRSVPCSPGPATRRAGELTDVDLPSLSLPVRHTFVHFPEDSPEGSMESPFSTWPSAASGTFRPPAELEEGEVVEATQPGAATSPFISRSASVAGTRPAAHAADNPALGGSSSQRGEEKEEGEITSEDEQEGE